MRCKSAVKKCGRGTQKKSYPDCCRCMWKTIRLWKLPISFDSWVGFVLFTNSGFPWGEAKVWEAEWKGMHCQRKTNYQQQQQQKAKTTLSFIVHGFLVKQSLLSFKTLCEKTDTYNNTKIVKKIPFYFLYGNFL